MIESLSRQSAAKRLETFQDALKMNLVFLFMIEAEIIGQHIADTGPQRMPKPLFSRHPLRTMGSADWMFEDRRTTATYYQGETRGGDVNLTYQALGHVPESEIKNGTSKKELISHLRQSEKWSYARTANEQLISMRDHARWQLISSFPGETVEEAIQYLAPGNLATIAEHLNCSEQYAHQVVRRQDKSKVSKKTRKQVLERDNHECTACSQTGNLHVHHIRPAAKGGNGDINNLAVVCATCHAEIHRSNVDTQRKFSIFISE